MFSLCFFGKSLGLGIVLFLLLFFLVVLIAVLVVIVGRLNWLGLLRDLIGLMTNAGGLLSVLDNSHSLLASAFDRSILRETCG